MNSSELEEGQDYPESSLLGTRPRYSYQRPLIRPGRIDGCTRFLLYIFVALQIILLPFGMLYIFAGMESDETMLSTAPDSHHDHEHEHEPVVTSAAELPLSSTSILQTPTATSSSTSSITIASASPLPGLPKRELTNFVDTLIGTEGYGHCTLLRGYTANYSFRWLNNTIRNGKGGSGQQHSMAESSRLSP